MMTDKELVFRCSDELYGDIPFPEPAYSYLESQRNAQKRNRGALVDHISISEEDIKVRDALELGWCLKVPIGMHVKVTDPEEFEEISAGVSDGFYPDGLVESLDELNKSLSENYIRIDTGWDVVVPDGYDLIMMPAFAVQSRKYTIISERYSPDGDERCVRVDPILRMTSKKLSFPEGYGLVVVLPMPKEDTKIQADVGVRTKEDDIIYERAKNGNRMYDYYSEKARGLHPKPKITEVVDPD